jgi:hypothetical protein
MLLSPQIFTTVEITTKFELTQNAVKIQARLDKGALYIIEDQTRLNIYVPKSSRDKELCYRRLLLSRLLAKLMRGEGAITTTHFDPRAFGIVANIIICSDLIIEDILEDAGIIRVSFPAAYVSYTVPETLSGMPEPKRYASGSDRTAFKPGGYSSTPPPPGHTTRDPGLRAQFDEPPITLAASRRPDQFPVIDLLGVNSSTPDYRRLLDDLINAAKRRQGKFPSKGAFDIQGLTSVLPIDVREVQPN